MISSKIIVTGLALTLLSGIVFAIYVMTSDAPSCLELTVDRCTFSYGAASVTFTVQGNLSSKGLRFLLSNESASLAIDKPSFVLNESRSYAMTLPDPRIFTLTRAQILPLENSAECPSSESVPCSLLSVQPLGDTYSVRTDVSNFSSGSDSSGSSSGSGSGSGPSNPLSNQPPTAYFIVSPLSGVSPLIVTFDASDSSDDHGIVTYVWDFGDTTLLINESDALVVQHTYGNPGEYNATLTLYDGGGLMAQYSAIIHVLAPLPCFDGLDNDGDGAIDGADYSCSLGGEFEDSLITECQDGLDNDANSLIDFPDDSGCLSSQDTSEFSPLINPAPFWGLVNNGLPIADSTWSKVSLASDSQGNILHMFTDLTTQSTYVGRFNSALKTWERYTQQGWSSDVTEYYKVLGSSSFGGSTYELIPGFSNLELFGLETTYPKIGSGSLFDMHTNNFNVKFNPLTGSLVRWYNGSTYSIFNAQSMIWNQYGSSGGLARSFDSALFIKTTGKTTALNFTASRYDVSLDRWGTWYKGLWNYTYPLASFQNSPIPFTLQGELPSKFYPSKDAIVASISQTDDFLILYLVKQGASNALRAALYNATDTQWWVWNNGWTKNYSSQQNIATSTTGFTVASPNSAFYDNEIISVPYLTDTGWRLLRYNSSNSTFDLTASPFGLATNALTFSSDDQNLTWIAYRTGSNLYLLNYTAGVYSTPLLISSNFSDTFSLIGLEFVNKTPLIYYQDLSFKTYVISNLNDPLWSSEVPLPLIQTPSTSLLDPLYGVPVTGWLTEAKITVNDSTGTPQTFINAYGPVLCGHIAFDSEMAIYCPQASTTSVIIYPLNYSSSVVPPYPEETARVWGNFWEYQLFPASVSIDNVRNKTYIVESSWWGGGSEAFPSGSVKIWDKSKKSEFVVGATSRSPPTFNQTYVPATLFIQNSRFNRPSGTAIDEVNGILYVTESAKHRIDRFDLVNLQNGLPRYLGNFGSEGSGDGQFSYPQGIGVDSEGNVYVVDTDNSRVEKFDSNGIFIKSWGGWGSAPGLFRYPFSIAVDKIKQYVYVSDPYNARLQIFDENGNFIYAFGSTDSAVPDEFKTLSGVAAHNNTLALSVKKGSYQTGMAGYIKTVQMNLP